MAGRNGWKPGEKAVAFEELLKIQGLYCAFCGKRGLSLPPKGVGPRVVPRNEATIDHKTPRCLGGDNSLPNLCISCFDCNNKRSKREQLKRNNPTWSDKVIDAYLSPRQVQRRKYLKSKAKRERRKANEVSRPEAIGGMA